MQYEEIKNNRESFKISENLYQCPICKKNFSIKGFIQHVKNHFIHKDLTNFINIAILNGKKEHKQAIEKYNKNPNKCLYCGKDILAKEKDKVYFIKQKKFCNKHCFARYNNLYRNKSVNQKVKETWKNKEYKSGTCKFCGKSFKIKCSRQVFCSKKCKEKSYGTKEDLIKWINDFIQKNGFFLPVK